MSIKSFMTGCLCAIVAGSFVGSVTGYLETRAAEPEPKLVFAYAGDSVAIDNENATFHYDVTAADLVVVFG